jgi:hypothetical protein
MVLSAELSPQAALFVKDDEQVESGPNAERIDEQRRSSEHNDPAKKHCEHAQVNGISRVAVQAPDDKFFRRIDGRRRATPKGGEIPHAPKVDDAANHKESEGKKKHQARCGRPIPGKKQRNVDAYRSWNDQREQKILQQ